MSGVAYRWQKTRAAINDNIASSPVGRYFRLEGCGHPLERKGAVFTRELRAGLVTFAAMAYSTYKYAMIEQIGLTHSSHFCQCVHTQRDRRPLRRIAWCG